MDEKPTEQQQKEFVERFFLGEVLPKGYRESRRRLKELKVEKPEVFNDPFEFKREKN